MNAIGTETKAIRETAKRGFTLIEIMVVIAIIGMLSVVAVPAVMGYLEDARRETTRSLIKAIEDSCNTYNMKHGGKYPKALTDLMEGDDENPPLLEGDITDPWGNDIIYEVKGKRVYLHSMGPDGEDQQGAEGSDDICNSAFQKKRKDS